MTREDSFDESVEEYQTSSLLGSIGAFPKFLLYGDSNSDKSCGVIVAHAMIDDMEGAAKFLHEACSSGNASLKNATNDDPTLVPEYDNDVVLNDKPGKSNSKPKKANGLHLVGKR